MKSCKTCKWLDVEPDSIGRIVVRNKNSYQCTVEIPKPPLPDCVLNYYHFKWPPYRVYVNSKNGENCQLFEKRIKND